MLFYCGLLTCDHAEFDAEQGTLNDDAAASRDDIEAGRADYLDVG